MAGLFFLCTIELTDLEFSNSGEDGYHNQKKGCLLNHNVFLAFQTLASFIHYLSVTIHFISNQSYHIQDCSDPSFVLIRFFATFPDSIKLTRVIYLKSFLS